MLDVSAGEGLDGRQTSILTLARTVQKTGYHFTTVTPETHRRVLARDPQREAQSLADVFGWSLPFEAGLVPEKWLRLLDGADLLQSEGRLLRSRIRLSSAEGLLFVHSAYPTSGADAVFFGPDTYRFLRALSVVSAGLRSPGRAVDIGCGAGPGGIVTGRRFPACSVDLVDINPAALSFARINAVLAGATNCSTRLSDLLTATKGDYDLIVANPPYLVDAAERAYRHGGGPLGADLSLAIVDAAMQRLSPGGTLALYTGVAIVGGRDLFRENATPILERAGVVWDYSEIDPDVFGEELEGAAYRDAERIAAVLLVAKKKAP